MPPKGRKKKSTRLVRSVAKPVSKIRRKKVGRKVVPLKRGPIVRGAEMIGQMIAPGIGGHVGRLAGYAGQRLYNYVTGSGAYSIASNSLMGVSNVPSFGETVIRMSAREYLGDINGSLDFKNRQFFINPGNPRTFPWLSQVANQFQQYKIHGLLFEFVSTSSNALNSINTALGKVIMATSYNVSAPPFTDVKSALVSQFANMGKPADNLVHAIECRKGSSVLDDLYVSTNGSGTEDPKFYDFGNFQLITEGMQAVSDIGGLWVSYDITLLKPTLLFNDALIPTQSWANILGGNTGIFDYKGDAIPAVPAVGVTPFASSPIDSWLEINNPRIGDKYMFQMTAFASDGKAITLPSIISTVDGLVGDAFQRDVGTGGSAAFWEIVRWVEVTSSVPVSFPFIGMHIVTSVALPATWSTYLTVTKLNPQTPWLAGDFTTVSMTRDEAIAAIMKRGLDSKLPPSVIDLADDKKSLASDDELDDKRTGLVDLRSRVSGVVMAAQAALAAPLATSTSLSARVAGDVVTARGASASLAIPGSSDSVSTSRRSGRAVSAS